MSLAAATDRLYRLRTGEVNPTGPAEHPPTVTCLVDPSSIAVDYGRMAQPPVHLQVDGYDILEVIGTGGMGVVLKARHRQLNRIVALKMLGRDAIADPDSHQRFQAEAEAVARLQHPNIIQVFDVGTFEERPGSGRHNPYLTLEYVDGGSLYRSVLSPQDPVHAARLVEKLARAIHAAHQVGVIHRDLKPANVLMTRDGEPKIADFGLAKQLKPSSDAGGQRLTIHGAAVGTPEYMAPEQVDGAAPTPAIDIYALGVILYELLTARLPFKGLTVTETMLLVKFQEPVSPRQLQPNLPRDLETICLKCMAKAAGSRYLTADGLADDLTRWLTGQPILARPVSRVERFERWARRNPTVAALSATAVALAVIGVAGVTWKWRDAERNARFAEANAREAHAHSLAQRWELYRANIAVASSSLQLSNLNSFRGALARAAEEHRNWEWDYFRHQLDSARQVIPAPGGSVAAAQAVGPMLGVTNRDSSGRVWDLAGRREIPLPTDADIRSRWELLADAPDYLYRMGEREVRVRPFHTGGREVVLPHPDAAEGFALTAHGRHLLTATDFTVFRAWDVGDGRLKSTVRNPYTAAGTAALSADGRLAAVHVGNTAVLVWDTETGEPRFTLAGLKDLLGLCFSPAGDRLLATEAYPSCVLRVFDTRTGDKLADLSGHTNNVKCRAFSPDGRRFAVGSLDQTVRVWDLDTGARAVFRGHTSAVLAIAFSPDGKRLVSGGDDQTVRVWDAATAAPLAVLRGHTATVLATAFTPSGEEVVSASSDGTLRYWDVRAAVANGVYGGHDSFVYQAAFHPDERHVVSVAWDGTARVWDTATGAEVGRFDHPTGTNVFAVAIHLGGRLLATLSRKNTLHLWDFDTRTLLHTWTVPSEHWKSGRLAFHPSSDLLACGCTDGTVRLFDVRRREAVGTLSGHRDAVRDVQFSPDGRWLVTAGDDGDKTVRVWDVARREQVRELVKHADGVYVLAFSRDGRTLASGSLDGTVQLWNTANWGWVGELPHGVKVYGLAFSKDGTRLACGCADNSIRLWDVARREEVVELRGHTDYVHSVAFSPDGTQLVSASGDKTVRVWAATPARER